VLVIFRKIGGQTMIIEAYSGRATSAGSLLPDASRETGGLMDAEPGSLREEICKLLDQALADATPIEPKAAPRPVSEAYLDQHTLERSWGEPRAAAQPSPLATIDAAGLLERLKVANKKNDQLTWTPDTARAIIAALSPYADAADLARIAVKQLLLKHVKL